MGGDNVGKSHATPRPVKPKRTTNNQNKNRDEALYCNAFSNQPWYTAISGGHLGEVEEESRTLVVRLLVAKTINENVDGLGDHYLKFGEVGPGLGEGRAPEAGPVLDQQVA